MSDYPDPKRLDDIVKALTFCGEDVTAESVRAQFFYETARKPDAGQLERAARFRS